MIWLVQLVFDCHDPDVITAFWGRFLEYDSELARQSPDEVAAFRAEHPQFDGRGRLDDRELRRMPVYLQRVPETKVGRNRVRLEVTVPPNDIAAGESADPEDNEYTVVVDETASTSGSPRSSSMRSIPNASPPSGELLPATASTSRAQGATHPRANSHGQGPRSRIQPSQATTFFTSRAQQRSGRCRPGSLTARWKSPAFERSVRTGSGTVRSWRPSRIRSSGIVLGAATRNLSASSSQAP